MCWWPKNHSMTMIKSRPVEIIPKNCLILHYSSCTGNEIRVTESEDIIWKVSGLTVKYIMFGKIACGMIKNNYLFRHKALKITDLLYKRQIQLDRIKILNLKLCVKKNPPANT